MSKAGRRSPLIFAQASVSQLEARLGFDTQWTLSRVRTNDVIENSEIDRFLKRLVDMQKQHQHLTQREIGQSEHIRDETLGLFHEVGPSFWPDLDKGHGPIGRFRIDPCQASKNPWAKEYPRHLRYSNAEDRKL
jgi:hypothetical protein